MSMEDRIIELDEKVMKLQDRIGQYKDLIEKKEESAVYTSGLHSKLDKITDKMVFLINK